MANKKKNNGRKSIEKKEIKKVEKQIDEMDSFVKNKFSILAIIFGVLCFFGIFYLLTVYITNDDTSKSTVDEINETEIQYEEILAGSSFNMNEKEYLVIYYDKSDDDISSKLGTAISTYDNNEDALVTYTVDMSSAFNKSFVNDEANSDPSEASELSLAGPTLIKFSDGDVVEYIESVDGILDYLN